MSNVLSSPASSSDYYSCDEYIPKRKHLCPDHLRGRRIRPMPIYPVDIRITEIININPHFKTNKPMTSEAYGLLKELLKLKAVPKKDRVTKENYNTIFKWALQMEHELELKEMRAYDQKDAKVFYIRDPFPGIKEAYYVNLKICDEVYEIFQEAIDDNKISRMEVEPMKDLHRNDEDYASFPQTAEYGFEKYTTAIKVVSNRLYFRSSKKLDSKQKYFIQFLLNPTTYRRNRQALSFIKKHQLYPVMFPTGPFEGPVENVIDNENGLLWVQPNLNIEQKTAVQNILCKTSHPYPFVLFGPPGTGKSKTLIEAIAQILKTTEGKVLVCAQSNLACDVLATRLLKEVPKDNIYRLFSILTNPYNVSEELQDISNIDIDKNGEAVIGAYPDLDFLDKFRVIVCTLTMAGRFCQADITIFYPNHFSYVVVDECASATDISAFIPIAGVCSAQGEMTAHMVIAGDPKQLGPVVKCKMANELGLGVSLVERLMKGEPYIKDPDTKSFNNRYILQLTQNYRSHKLILDFSNKEFYGRTMIPKANRSIVTTFINREILPSPQFPIVFKSVQGKCRRYNKYSWCNESEMLEVISYVDQLKKGQILPNYRGSEEYGKRKKTVPVDIEDIGVVSTYRGQCRVILKKCTEKGWNNLKVGSVNLFQGEEKPVIIATTVRSDECDVGFLRDWKRLNVLMTRAKALLIIIGDPFTLRKDKNWRKLLVFLQNNNAIIQSRRHFSI